MGCVSATKTDITNIPSADITNIPSADTSHYY